MSFCARGKFWEKEPHTHSPPPLSVVGVSNTLPMRYDANISTIEDRPKLDKLTIDHLRGIFIAYEMRRGNEKP
jgi:hypothetical protein